MLGTNNDFIVLKQSSNLARSGHHETLLIPIITRKHFDFFYMVTVQQTFFVNARRKPYVFKIHLVIKIRWETLTLGPF